MAMHASYLYTRYIHVYTQADPHGCLTFPLPYKTHTTPHQVFAAVLEFGTSVYLLHLVNLGLGPEEKSSEWERALLVFADSLRWGVLPDPVACKLAAN